MCRKSIQCWQSRSKKVWQQTLLLLLVGLFTGAAVAQNAEPEPQFAPRGADTCLTCHRDPAVTDIRNTVHWQTANPATPAANQACESCHGASPTHISSMQSPAVVFSGNGRFPASDVATQNQMCLNCHQAGDRVHWSGSQHQSADVGCASCHSVHTAKTTVVNSFGDSGICLSCHLEQRSQLNRRSHHPIAEGLMSCSDCHNPHGSPSQSLLAKASVNETCAACHAEKRGPFLWEHQPVSEDCTICHNPHGSNQDRLLASRMPFLCQSCHSDVFHPSSLYSGTSIPPASAGQTVLGNSCTNCHSLIHGSNHPSGARLTR